MTATQNPALFSEVVRVLERALELEAVRPRVTLRPETALTELGLDSLTAVDLTVGLEEMLGVAEFPLQKWADAEATRAEPRFTIASLVAACAALLDQSRDGSVHPEGSAHEQR